MTNSTQELIEFVLSIPDEMSVEHFDRIVLRFEALVNQVKQEGLNIPKDSKVMFGWERIYSVHGFSVSMWFGRLAMDMINGTPSWDSTTYDDVKTYLLQSPRERAQKIVDTFAEDMRVFFEETWCGVDRGDLEYMIYHLPNDCEKLRQIVEQSGLIEKKKETNND